MRLLYVVNEILNIVPTAHTTFLMVLPYWRYYHLKKKIQWHCQY